jgi:RNA polymerase sigma factor for flagellar operon FliA
MMKQQTESGRLSGQERERMVLEQMPQVRYIARRIHDRLPKHVCLEDLINAGVVGLMDAINKYDAGKNVQFKSYAQFRVRGAILDSLRELDWSPRELRRKARAVESVIQVLSARLGRMPQDAEIAAQMGMDLSQYQALLGDLRGLEIGSLTVESHEQGNGNSEDLCASIAIDEEQGPYHQCLKSEMRDMLASGISQLSDREQQVLSLYYFEELNMKEIGEVLGVVESRVSQIHSAAIVKLRTLLRRKLDQRPGILASVRVPAASHAHLY